MAFPAGATAPRSPRRCRAPRSLNLEKLGARWLVVDGGFQSRRLDGGTLCRWSGPAATTAAVQGVLAPEAGCATPWGSALLAEATRRPGWPASAPADRRLRLGGGFGWVAELDPFDPQRRADQAHRPRPLRPRRRGGDPRPRRSRGGVHDRPAGQRLSPPLHVIGPGDRARRARRGNDLGGALRRRPARLAAGPARWRRRPGRGRFAARHPRRPRPGPDRAEAGALLPRQPARPRGYALEISATEGDDAAPDATVRTLFVAGPPWEGGQNGPGAARLPRGTAWPENPSAVAVDGRGRAWIGTDRAGVVGAQADGLYVCDLDGPGRGVPLPIYGARAGRGDRRRGADPGWRGALHRRPPSRRRARRPLRAAGHALAGIRPRRAAAQRPAGLPARCWRPGGQVRGGSSGAFPPGCS